MTMIKFVFRILEFFVLFIVAVSMITISETTSSNNTVTNKNQTKLSSIILAPNDEQSIPVTISTVPIKLNTNVAINASTSDIIEPLVVYYPTDISANKNNSIVENTSTVFYETPNENIDPKLSSKVIYDENKLETLKNDFDLFLKNQDHRTKFDSDDDDGDDDDDENEYEDNNLIDNRKQVVNIIEVKRPPSNHPPPETIIFRGRRFRLYKPDRYRRINQRKRIIQNEPVAQQTGDSNLFDPDFDIINPYEERNHRRKYLKYPKMFLPSNRGVPMIAKVYWRRIIYPRSSLTSRPKRKTIYKKSTSTIDDRGQSQPRKIEKYIVYYVKKDTHNPNRDRNETADQLVATSSNRLSKKIKLKSYDDDYEDIDSEMEDEDLEPNEEDDGKVPQFQKPIANWSVWRSLKIPSASPLPSPPGPSSAPTVRYYNHHYPESNAQELLLSKKEQNEPNQNFKIKKKEENQKSNHLTMSVQREREPEIYRPELEENHNKNNNNNNNNRKRKKNRKRNHSKSSHTKKFFKIVKYNIDE